jgi:ABC-type methionine transport system permease subunit
VTTLVLWVALIALGAVGGAFVGAGLGHLVLKLIDRRKDKE